MRQHGLLEQFHKDQGNYLLAFYFYACIVLALIALVLIPTKVFAASHTYTCADGLFGAGASHTCTGAGTFQLGSGGASSFYDTNGTAFLIDPSKTYHISYTASRNGNLLYDGRFRADGDSGQSDNSFMWVSGTNSELAFPSVASVGAHAGLLIYASTDGTVSNICIDDDGTSCTAAPAVLPSILGLVRSFWLW